MSLTQNGSSQQPAATALVPPAGFSAQVDLLVAINLWSWPALTLAIQNAWGGPSQVSQDKRDWFAGAVSEMLTSSTAQIHDVDDLEEVLIQVMVDEFEVVVDDGSPADISRKIWKGVDKLRKGDKSELSALYQQWQEKQARGGDKVVGIAKDEDEDGQDTDWDDDDNDEAEGQEEVWNGFSDGPKHPGDIDMTEAPPVGLQSTPRQKVIPKVDEDGFTEVVGKKKR